MNGVQLQHGSRSKASCHHIPVQDAVSGRNTHHLLSGHADRLNAELAVAHVEQVLQVRAEQVNNEDVVEALLTKVIGLRDSGWREGASKRLCRIASSADDARVPARVRYDRYSSRSCGASDLRGS